MAAVTPDDPRPFQQPEAASMVFLRVVGKLLVTIASLLLVVLFSGSLIPLAGASSAFAIPVVIFALVVMWFAEAGFLVFGMWNRESKGLLTWLKDALR